MGTSFQILAGETAGEVFRHGFLQNPIAGLIIGVLVTVLVQSSSTSTSIVVTMTGAGILTVREAIPIIMGANIGTSVTNTIVSLFQSMKVEEFRRAFAGATVHDVFNLLSVLVFLPLEVVSHYLEEMTGAILRGFSIRNLEDSPDLLNIITNLLTKRIVQVNKGVIKKIAQNITLGPNDSILKKICSSETISMVVNETRYRSLGATMATVTNATVLTEAYQKIVNKAEKVGIPCSNEDHYIFAQTAMPEKAVGGVLLVLSLVALCVCLLLMVKLLHSILRGGTAKMVKKVVNANFPKPFGWLTGYIAIIVGAALTFLVQSSSVFTSTLTPLVGIGVISLKRMYPLTLGSNIGTTTTGLLAALASQGSNFENALQIALCHLFFNISGILIWHPIPILKKVPIRGAKFLGNTTAKHRWFTLFYLIFVFFLIPATILGLSFAHIWAMGTFLILVALIITFVISINILQSRKPEALPVKLRTWKFLPGPMRSFKPYDRVFEKSLILCKCCGRRNDENFSKSAASVKGRRYDDQVTRVKNLVEFICGFVLFI
ncbi:sodium-dependent phosphate transport protein 2B-like isoform X1 [Clavelina lepadiformis]|uniref:sodium-dependent phosphate transport protein 2B-like isoform X1 n=1 Tax=Clavelina lepadiformis TaxID=159417 RepID=UPI004043913A